MPPPPNKKMLTFHGTITTLPNHGMTCVSSFAVCVSHHDYQLSSSPIAPLPIAASPSLCHVLFVFRCLSFVKQITSFSSFFQNLKMASWHGQSPQAQSDEQFGDVGCLALMIIKSIFPQISTIITAEVFVRKNKDQFNSASSFWKRTVLEIIFLELRHFLPARAPPFLDCKYSMHLCTSSHSVFME